MADILADYREWRQQQAARVSTHSEGCHMWHKDCMIHRLADALVVEQAKRTPERPSTPSEGTSHAECPYVTGTVTRYCTLTPLTLTDAEREAIERARQTLNAVQDLSPTATADDAMAAATLRGLLERTCGVR